MPITYHNTVNSTITVKLDGRTAGHIRTVNGFWQYKPKDGGAGELFPTLEACQQSLEQEPEQEPVATPTGQTIDITPVGLSTPEGVKRVEQARQEWDSATHLLANTLKEMWDANGYLLPEDRHQIAALIGARDRKQEAFLRAVAGAPPQEGQ